MMAHGPVNVQNNDMTNSEEIELTDHSSNSQVLH